LVDDIEIETIGKTSGYNPRVEEIQRILKNAGFGQERVDGILGPTTRRAIAEFQRQKGLKPTGLIDHLTLLALNREEERMKLITANATDASSSLNPQLPPLKSTFVSAGPATNETSDSFASKEKPDIKSIQQALKNAGFYKGKIDGKIGPKTRLAIKAFQKNNGLKVDGVVGSKTWHKLKRYLIETN